MKTNTHNQLGTLMYGKQIIAQDKPFSILEGIRKELLLMGYDSSLFHKHYKPQAMHHTTTPPAQVPGPIPVVPAVKDTNDYPDLTKHIPAPGDRTWLEHYVSTMGEKALFEYRDKVYARLDMLQVGETILIPQWCKPENYDLFIKVAYCYITENDEYRFENKYNAITHKYNAGEMEELRRICDQIAERRKNAGSDSRES